MAAVYVVSEDLTSKREVIVQVLRSIQGAVREHNAHVDGLEVNCNYMRAYPKTALPELKGRLKFTFGSLDRYPWFLALEEYADDKGREDFVLPVEERREHKSDRKSLPGAPLAFLLNETIVIDDLDHFKYPRNLPKTVVEELRAYFEGKSFKSFGSLNIRVSGKRLGIVNVEANKPFVFGRTEEEKTEITALLHPFCQLLGQMILKL